MSALTPFGIFHTVLSVVGLGAGIAAIVKYREIDTNTALGRVSLAATGASAVTGLAIFHHGGFGPPHVLSVLTLAALAIGFTVGRTHPRVRLVAFSATLFCHLVPALTETTTRLPASSPVFPGPDAPFLQVANLVLLAAFVVGVVIQLRARRA